MHTLKCVDILCDCHCHGHACYGTPMCVACGYQSRRLLGRQLVAVCPALCTVCAATSPCRFQYTNRRFLGRGACVRVHASADGLAWYSTAQVIAPFSSEVCTSAEWTRSDMESSRPFQSSYCTFEPIKHATCRGVRGNIARAFKEKRRTKQTLEVIEQPIRTTCHLLNNLCSVPLREAISCRR